MRSWKHLNHLQVGKYAEYLVKIALVSHGLDVYSSEVDDRGKPLSMLIRGQPVDIRKRNFTGSAREPDLPIMPFVSQGEHNLGRGKGNTFITFQKKGRKVDCTERAGSSRKDSGTSEETMSEGHFFN